MLQSYVYIDSSYEFDFTCLNFETKILEYQFSETFNSFHYLYYYRRAVLTNLSSKYDENIPVRSQFNSDHSVNFSTPTSCQSATFARPLFAFFLCFNEKNNQKTTR